MTNAAVASAVTSVNGQEVIVKYKDGEKRVLIEKDTPNRRLRCGRQGRHQAGRADHHLRGGEAAGRVIDSQPHQCRPWRHAADVIKR